MALVLLAVLLRSGGDGPGGPLVLEREGRVISLEPYAPNVLRVTMSIDKAAATARPDTGLWRTSAEGWTHERDAEGDDIFRRREWWCVWRQGISQRTSCRSRCRSML